VKVRFLIMRCMHMKLGPRLLHFINFMQEGLGHFCELDVVEVSFIQSKTLHLTSEKKNIRLLFWYLINAWCHHVTSQFECNWFSGEVEGTEAGFCGGFTEQEHVGVTCMHSPGKYQEQETGIWNFGKKGI